MSNVVYRNWNDIDLMANSDGAAIAAGAHGESLTVQSMAEDADINVMMKRFGITGQLPQGMRVPEYGDFSGVSDFRSALDAVRDAEANFMKLDGEVRLRFQNDPQLFLDFCSNPANMPELAKLGLAREGYGHTGVPGDVGAKAGEPGAVPAKAAGEGSGSAKGGS